MIKIIKISKKRQIAIPKVKNWNQATKPFRTAATKANFTEKNLQIDK